jgi:integrase
MIMENLVTDIKKKRKNRHGKEQWGFYFYLTLPDLSRERVPKLSTKGKASLKRAYGLAIMAVEKTLNNTYTQADIDYWVKEGLFSKRVAALLSKRTGGNVTVSQMGEEWLKRQEKSLAEKTPQVRHLVEILGPDTSISSLTDDDGLRVKDTLIGEPYYLKKKTANRCLTILHGGKRGGMIGLQIAKQNISYDPFMAVEHYGDLDDSLTRGRVPDDALFVILDGAIENDKKSNPKLGGFMEVAIIFYLDTGLRLNEGYQLTFDHVDFEKKIIHLPASFTKKKYKREIELDDRMVAFLRKTKLRHDHNYILPRFKGGTGTVSRAIITHVIACGFFEHRIDKKTGELALQIDRTRPGFGELKKFAKYSCHWLRHTNNTMMDENGVEIEKRKEKIGHQTDKQNEEYNHSVRNGITTPLVHEHLKRREG